MIIGITGLIGSGKDTIADYLLDKGFIKMSFAGSLKNAIANIFNWDRDLLEGSTQESREWRDKVDTWWAERLNIPHLTPRWILQHWGTEVGRKSFHNDIWIASLESKLIQYQGNIVVADCRFPNEIELIKNLNGYIIRTHRGPEKPWETIAKEYNRTRSEKLLEQLEKLGIHPSEYSSVGLNYDLNIDNNHTLEELYQQVDGFLQKISTY